MITLSPSSTFRLLPITQPLPSISATTYNSSGHHSVSTVAVPHLQRMTNCKYRRFGFRCTHRYRVSPSLSDLSRSDSRVVMSYLRPISDLPSASLLSKIGVLGKFFGVLYGFSDPHHMTPDPIRCHQSATVQCPPVSSPPDPRQSPSLASTQIWLVLAPGLVSPSPYPVSLPPDSSYSRIAPVK
ncbi:uncharacterized protein LOC120070128 isoform X2 [Benincasa hispida]|uniref:uncharacterized protein LOC120070128 isoform X2 n=1 Tax=Benincasa hispida TaxID=102211 RepID=UPI0019021504|nr:uncharacterized protein LOC120070128 isoform X2 [Benincasa hispida]